MEKIDMTDELLNELKEIQKAEQVSQVGLRHFASELKASNELFWKVINTAIPGTEGWMLRVDLKEKIIVKLYPKKAE